MDIQLCWQRNWRGWVQPWGISIHSDVVAPYIASFGTIDQKQRYLPKFITGEMISAFAWTEPEMGSELADIQTTAIKKDGYYLLNGAKTFVTNGFKADFMIVACKTDLNAVPPKDGISLLLIDKDTPGLSREESLVKQNREAQAQPNYFSMMLQFQLETSWGRKEGPFIYHAKTAEGKTNLCDQVYNGSKRHASLDDEFYKKSKSN